MIGIHFLNYNFVRKHQTIKTAPAVEAGVTDSPLKIEELVERFDGYRSENHPIQRPSTYRKSTVPKTFEPQTPRTPWYLDPESGGSDPAKDFRKENVIYGDDPKNH